MDLCPRCYTVVHNYLARGGGAASRDGERSAARGADMSGDAAPGDKKTVAGGEVDAESVLRQLGQLGCFHLRAYVLLALAALQVGLLHTTYIFLAGNVPYSPAPVTLEWCLYHKCIDNERGEGCGRSRRSAQ
ncbi:hypothetical protein PYW08_002972 [Mythimna loreyi]|uniref:Uncharacterized protein n=1 Tax=Mythimna loreyi TaxID=667449 RepID=A0ACC2QQE4_9NEOP|nr:hypothetical protein PYW08_002972 [Mythimna loreyi]